jgi:uncharacterized membrane protein (UPF0127 family)
MRDALAMPPAIVVRAASDGRIVCERCYVAATFLSRLVGLLRKPSLDPREGLLLTRAAAVHTLFMRFPIDVVFLDRERRVVAVSERLRPWRHTSCPGARAVLELPADAWKRSGCRVGDALRYSPPRSGDMKGNGRWLR